MPNACVRRRIEHTFESSIVREATPGSSPELPSDPGGRAASAGERVETPPPADLTPVLDLIRSLTGADLADPERIDAIALLERIKGAAAGAQARVALAFDANQRAAAAERGVRSAQQGRGIADQVALARRESPFLGSSHLALARALPEMPHTRAALETGATSEWRAALMMRETAALSREDRTAVDAEVGPRLPRLGDQQVAAEARRAGYRLDPHSLVNRIKRAESDRTVTVRPAPDTMSYLTGSLPMVQGVAVYAALRHHADSLRGSGDSRSRGQIMADTLVARVTGLADDGDGVRPPVEVHLVMTDESLMGDSDDPADVVCGGSLPAWLARRVVAEAHRAWLRRLYTHPDASDLVATDATRRAFTGQQRQFLIVRDKLCRTPYCGAPIRHADHVVEHDSGGPTSTDNGQGLCERCNYVKQVSHWRSLVVSVAGGGHHRVTLTTPTGHTYVSEPPRPPGSGPPALGIDLYLHDVSIEDAA